MFGVSILALITLAIYAFWMYLLHKRHPELSYHQLMNRVIGRNSLSIYMGMVVLAVFAEATMAASLLVGGTGSHGISPEARFAGHLLMQAASLVGALFIVVEWKALWLFPYGRNLKEWKNAPIILWIFILRLFRVCMATGMAFGFPIYNAKVMANGLQSSAALHLWWVDMWQGLFYSKQYYVYLLAKGGHQLDYESWDALSYPMIATIGITIAHLIFLLVDIATVADPDYIGILNGSAASSESSAASGGSGSSAPSASASASTSSSSTSTSSAPQDEATKATERLLRAYGLDDDAVKAKMETTKKIVDTMPQKAQIKLGQVLEALEDKLNSLEADEKDGRIKGAALTAAKADLADQIKKSFAESASRGLGFGISLPKPTKNS